MGNETKYQPPDGACFHILVENSYSQIMGGNDDAVIPLVDEIIRTAYKNGASDLHIEILNRKLGTKLFCQLKIKISCSLFYFL